MAKVYWHGALLLHKRAVHAATCLEREVAGTENSLSFFQVVFTRVVVESSAAESMPPRYQREATTSILSDPTWTSLCGVPSKGCAVPWHHVHLKSGSLSSA